jgi:hypothetical protein
MNRNVVSRDSGTHHQVAGLGRGPPVGGAPRSSCKQVLSRNELRGRHAEHGALEFGLASCRRPELQSARPTTCSFRTEPGRWRARAKWRRVRKLSAFDSGRRAGFVSTSQCWSSWSSCKRLRHSAILLSRFAAICCKLMANTTIVSTSDRYAPRSLSIQSVGQISPISSAVSERR